MGDILSLPFRDDSGADFHSAVNLHAICGDNGEVVYFGDLDRHGAFPARRRATQNANDGAVVPIVHLQVARLLLGKIKRIAPSETLKGPQPVGQSATPIQEGDISLVRSLFAALAATVSLLLLPAVGVTSQPDRIEIMHPRDLKPGDRGYGLTVFKGVEPERFEVEILGVLGNRFAGGDMILFRIDPRPEFDDIGVVAGMSGSPVFVDDKLIGAVAYGWGFSVRPIGGITPSTDMMEILDLVTEEPNLPPEEVPAGYHLWESTETPTSFDELDQFLRALRQGRSGLEPMTFPADKLRGLGIEGIEPTKNRVTFQPLSTPLSVSTQSSRVMELTERFFSGTHLQPVMTGQAASTGGSGRVGHLTDEEYDSLEAVDGGALAVVLVDGDLQLAGTGTTTYVEGDRLIGFGHPMFGSGSVDAPIYVSEIASFIPSVIRPFKIGNAVKEIGALREDRLAAIGGTTSARSRMIPLSIQVSADDTGIDRTFNFRVWDNRDYIPFLSTICYLEALEKVSRLDGPMTLDTEYIVHLADGRQLRRVDFSSGNSGTPFTPLFQMMMDLGTLVNNRFEPVEVERIEVVAEIRRRHQLMRLDRYTRGPMELRRGETYRATVRYTQWRQEPIDIPIEVPIPRDIRPGNYEIMVLDGFNREMLEGSLRPELRHVTNLDELLRSGTPSFPDDAIHIVLVDPTAHHVFEGKMLENLPASVAFATEATVRQRGQAYRGGGRLVSETVQRFPAEVLGSTSFSVTVLDK